MTFPSAPSADPYKETITSDGEGIPPSAIYLDVVEKPGHMLFHTGDDAVIRNYILDMYLEQQQPDTRPPTSASRFPFNQSSLCFISVQI